jgi:hypothetical protein
MSTKKDDDPMKGTCQACQQSLALSNCKRHLFFCSKMLEYLTNHQYNVFNDTAISILTTTGYILKISDLHRPHLYYIYLAAPDHLSLRDLDVYLRALWLQCCSHMSCFSTDTGKEYYPQLFSNPSFPNFENHFLMSEMAISDFFSANDHCAYEYDFADRTQLQIQVIQRITNAPKQKFTLLIRNEEPQYYCDSCQERIIIRYCQACRQSFCEGCFVSSHLQDTKKKESKSVKNSKKMCGSDYCLPVVNSPRVGKCGYVGPIVDASNLTFNVFDPERKNHENNKDDSSRPSSSSSSSLTAMSGCSSSSVKRQKK